MEQSTEDRVLPHHIQTGLDRSHYFDVEEVEEGGPAEGVVGGKMLLVGELIVGVVVGTYSSIYIASSMLIVLNVTSEDLIPDEKETEEIDELP